MKKLLILAYDFPPYVSVGALRPYNWLKYLKEFGVEPIVVTRQWGNKYGNAFDYIAPSATTETIIEHTEFGTIIRTPFKPTISNRLLLKYGENRFRLLRKSLTAINEVFQFLCISGPRKELYKAADVYLKQNKVDGIIATGEPFVLFYYAKKLGERYNIPWIADYRDPWSKSKYGFGSKLFSYWNRKIENNIVVNSTSIITVSEFFRINLKTLFPDKQIHILPNGFDPDVIDQFAHVKQRSDVLTIGFVGTIYEWHPWESFIKQIVEFNKKSLTTKVFLDLYGTNIPTEIEEYLNSFDDTDTMNIRVYPKIENHNLLKKLSEYNAMLLFNDYDIVGTKIYDYLALRRKIIFCYSNDSNAIKLKEQFYTYFDVDFGGIRPQIDIIQQTNSGIIVENEQHLQQVLLELVQEFEATGQIACHSQGVENYSRKIQVQKLAEIVKQLSKN